MSVMDCWIDGSSAVMQSCDAKTCDHISMMTMADEFGSLNFWPSSTSRRLASLALKSSNVSPSKSHMAHSLLSPFAAHLHELAALVKEMERELEIRGTILAASSTSKMDRHLQDAEQLVEEYSNHCPMYLLMCCPDLWLRLQHCYGNFNEAIESFLDDTAWSSSLQRRLADEKQALNECRSIKLAAKEQSLHDLLEHDALDSIATDAVLASKLAKQVAECLGFTSLVSEGFANEVARLKEEKVSAEMRRGKAHALYVEQLIVLLEKAIAAAKTETTIRVPELMAMPSSHHGRRDTLILPLKSFICSITQDVMRDPVQIASGQTYERKAIERWFAEGHTRCPTGVQLGNLNMKSNIALKQSIAEWKERNNNIMLDHANDLLRSGEEEHQLKALHDLQNLCEEEKLCKYGVASKNLLPVLVHLTESSDLELRKKAFCVLSSLAENEECQDLMVKENIIQLVVRCLARQNDEAAVCVQLMRALSENSAIAEKISRAPSAVLFLVTLIQDEHCADNVKAILENLPKSDENAVIMAESNIMRPLVTRLNEGDSASKVLMAKTLGRLHMPDSSKVVAATGETVQTLVKMVETGREEEREAAMAALEKLSTVAAARQGLQLSGALPILLNTLKGVRHSEAVKQSSAATLANILGADDWEMTDGELEDTVCLYFQLLGPSTPVQVQQSLLKGLLGLAQCSKGAARQKMKDCDAFTCLLRHLLLPDNNSLQRHCVELLTCLAVHFHQEAAQAIIASPAAVSVLAKILKDSRSDAELQGAITFFASLPSKDEQITSLMLQEEELMQLLIKVFKNHQNDGVVEATAGALLRFTSPSNLSLQLTLASEEVIPLYVALLRSGGVFAKKRAARALYNFSLSSRQLSEPMEVTMGSACLLGCFFRRQPVAVCRVHGGVCNIKTTFCLLEAKAVAPLVETLRGEGMKEGSSSCVVAALMALQTLVDADGDLLEQGCCVIENHKGMIVIINLMSSPVLQVQELAARLCEKFFSIQRYRAQYAAQAQMHIITLAQKGTPPLRQLAGRLLRHLELLHSQSNYFGASTSTTMVPSS